MADIWLVDLGSSRLKWQTRSELGTVLAQGGGIWQDASGNDLLPPLAPKRVWVCRVGPERREQELRAAILARHGPVPVVSLRPDTQGPGGLSLNYDPEQLGADRYCALLAVQAHGGGPAVVVDAGTAVTVDFLAAGGRHLGGYILPGFRLGLAAVAGLLPEALAARVSQAAEAAVVEIDQRPDPRPGGNTAEALLRGWGCGLAAAVARLAQSAPFDGQAAPAWWLTGGDAPWLAQHLNHSLTQVPDLVLDGLWVWAKACREDAA